MTIERQDEAGAAGAPLGAFVDGKLLGTADPKTDPSGEDLRRRTASEHSDRPVEILITCPRHPSASAVDCLDCDPTE